MNNANKTRVYELAKELGYACKDFLDMLRQMGVDARSNFSILEDPTVKGIRDMLKNRGEDGPIAPRVETQASNEQVAAPVEPATPEPPPVKRTPTPKGVNTMVTTIDPDAAARVSMARSTTGPKPKPGGEVRRIIPAHKLEALRAHQAGGATEAAGGTPPVAPRPTDVTAQPSPQRPAATSPGVAPTRTVPPTVVPPSRPTVGTTPAPARPVPTSPTARIVPPPASPTRPPVSGTAAGVAAVTPQQASVPPAARPLTPTPTPSRPISPPPARPTSQPQTPVTAVRPPVTQTVSPTRPTATPTTPPPPRPGATATPGTPPPPRRVPVGQPPAPQQRPTTPPGALPVQPEMVTSRGPAPPRPVTTSAAFSAGTPPGHTPQRPPMSSFEARGPSQRNAPPSIPVPITPDLLPPQPPTPGGRGRGGPPPRNGGGPGPRGGPQRGSSYSRPGQMGMRGGRNDRGGPRKKGFSQPTVQQPQLPQVELRDLELPDHISVMELASKLEISPTEIIKTLMSQGLLVTINQTITFDKAQQIAVSHGFNAILTEEHEEVTQESEKEEDLEIRPPVVTVLGHVDHGKTSLLDAIRNTNVTAGEAGGITQRIGAYVVEHNGRKVTFIDTPGHEAFTAMRKTGAKVTDVAVLVVAADDGVMPQTVEAINHAKAAKVPIVVAINKIDKPNANVDRVKQQLIEHQLVPEDWGGQTICCPMSARQRIGINDLIEMILLVTDMQELKANPDRNAIGTIIEAKLDKGLGPVATVLVQAGTLKLNDAVVAGAAWGKVRALINDKGKRINRVLPGMPGEIIGLSSVPVAGDMLQVVDDEKIARQIAVAREQRTRERGMSSTGGRTSLEDLFRQMQEGEVKDLNLIVKADNQGSLEALKHSLGRLSDDNVKVSVIHGGMGTINESDVTLASASGAIVIGFNVRPDPNVKKLADQEGVDIRHYRVIYDLLNDIGHAMKGLLAPEYQEVSLGRLEVRQVFKVSKVGTIAGCIVHDGKVVRTADVRVLRDGVVVYEGKLDSLKRFKDDVREVTAGYECGLSIEKFPGIQEKDILEVYKMEEKPRD